MRNLPTTKRASIEKVDPKPRHVPKRSINDLEKQNITSIFQLKLQN